jgi:hypothetical protein
VKAILLYRIASVLLILVAAGNTYSLLRFWQVAGSMNPVLFPLGHTGITYFQVVVALESVCSLGCSVWGIFGLASGWSGSNDSPGNWRIGMGPIRLRAGGCLYKLHVSRGSSADPCGWYCSLHRMR